MASPLNYLTEGSRIFLSSWKNRFAAKKYSGDADKICEQVVENCWNGRFFMTATDNFPQFWARDFGWCTQSLLKLGYRREVMQTLRYAFNRFKQHNKITTTITPRGKPFDFPNMAVDSLPWFIHSIKIAKFEYYEHRHFLNLQIKKFYDKVVDPSTGLVKKNEQFSSMKDFSVRQSSCYDNCMVSMLAKDLESLKLINPFSKHNYPKLILENFWNGSFFYDDLNKEDYIAGDANIFPFLTGVINDKEILKVAISAIQEAGLDKPFPLKYTNQRSDSKFILQELFLKDYESTAVWMHMGPLFVKLVQQVDSAKAAEYKLQYRKKIENHKNFMEVYDKNGKPFSTPFYYSSPGMLWAANYLTL